MTPAELALLKSVALGVAELLDQEAYREWSFSRTTNLMRRSSEIRFKLTAFDEAEKP